MVKITCEKGGVEATLQQIGSSGNYYRCKHYRGMTNNKPQYYYHQVSKAYAENQLSLKGVKICKKSKNIDLKKKSIDLEKVNIDQEKPKSGSKLKMELGMGIEPIYSSSAGYRLNHSATPAT